MYPIIYSIAYPLQAPINWPTMSLITPVNNNMYSWKNTTNITAYYKPVYVQPAAKYSMGDEPSGYRHIRPTDSLSRIPMGQNKASSSASAMPRPVRRHEHNFGFIETSTVTEDNRAMFDAESSTSKVSNGDGLIDRIASQGLLFHEIQHVPAIERELDDTLKLSIVSIIR